MTIPSPVLAALRRLNGHARAWGCGKEAIYAYKTLAAILLARAGEMQARPVGMMARCRRCDGTGRFHWNGEDTGERCRTCGARGYVHLRFCETTFGNIRWHHPWITAGAAIFRASSNPADLEYQPDTRSLRITGRDGITGLAKARHVAAYVRMLAAAGEPVLLAGWHREVYEVWKRELAPFNPVMYTGSESTVAKDKAKNAFIAGTSRVMFISLRSGAGLDGLQAVCNTLVVGELDWSPQVIDQLIWRLRRLGQQRWPVNALIPYADGGSDPAMATTLGIKKSQSRGITDPMKGVEQVCTDDSRIRLLAQRYLEQRASGGLIDASSRN